MHENTRRGFGDTCAALTAQINDIRGQLRAAEENEKLREAYTQKIALHDKNARLSGAVVEQLKPIAAASKEYLAERKTESLQNINNALRMAGEIIRDSMSGIKLSIDKEDATITSEDGCEIQIMEGGGYRQISSAFIRSVILGAAPQFLQTMFLDETFALVNSENSATLSLYLQLIGEQTQIISIEQKNEIYLNNDYISYKFSKAENYSTVERIEHHASGSIDGAVQD